MAPTSAFRLSLLLPLLLVVAVIGTLSAADNGRLHQQEQQQELSTDARLSAAVSGCGLCARSGQCEHAFRGSPGQFCQTLVSGAPCCCPADAQCVLTNAYNCRCRRSTHVRSSDTTNVNAPAGSVALTLLLMGCCVCCCCCCAARDRHKRRHQHDYYAEPVYTTTQYGTNVGEYPGQQAPQQQQQGYPYAYASAPPEFEDSRYETTKGGGNGGEFAAAALGAAGGLATGVFLGSAFGGRSGGSYQQTSSSYFGGDSGGGDFGGVAASTFEFSGDTGGDGGDDDGGDFGGDS